MQYIQTYLDYTGTSATIFPIPILDRYLNGCSKLKYLLFIYSNDGCIDFASPIGVCWLNTQDIEGLSKTMPTLSIEFPYSLPQRTSTKNSANGIVSTRFLRKLDELSGFLNFPCFLMNIIDIESILPQRNEYRLVTHVHRIDRAIKALANKFNHAYLIRTYNPTAAPSKEQEKEVVLSLVQTNSVLSEEWSRRYGIWAKIAHKKNTLKDIVFTNEPLKDFFEIESFSPTYMDIRKNITSGKETLFNLGLRGEI